MVCAIKDWKFVELAYLAMYTAFSSSTLQDKHTHMCVEFVDKGNFKKPGVFK